MSTQPISTNDSMEQANALNQAKFGELYKIATETTSILERVGYLLSCANHILAQFSQENEENIENEETNAYLDLAYQHCEGILFSLDNLNIEQISQSSTAVEKITAFINHDSVKLFISYSDKLKIIFATKILDIFLNTKDDISFSQQTNEFGKDLDKIYLDLCHQVLDIISNKSDFENYFNYLNSVITDKFSYWKSYEDIEQLMFCFVIYSFDLMKAVGVTPLHISKFTQMRNNYISQLDQKNLAYTKIQDPLMLSVHENVSKLSNTVQTFTNYQTSIAKGENVEEYELAKSNINLYITNLYFLLHIKEDKRFITKRMFNFMKIIAKSHDVEKSFFLFASKLLTDYRLATDSNDLDSNTDLLPETIENVNADVDEVCSRVARIIKKLGVREELENLAEEDIAIIDLYHNYIKKVTVDRFCNWPELRDVEDFVFLQLSYSSNILDEYSLTMNNISNFRFLCKRYASN